MHEDEAEQRRDANQLRDQLAGVAVEQAGHRAGHAVPGAAVVALAVGEEPDGDDAPDAVGAVHRDRADRVVQLQHALDELAREAHEHAGDQADDRRRPSDSRSRWAR